MAVGVINTLRIYEKLCEKLDEPQARAAVEVIELAFEEYRENQKEFPVTKEEFKETIANLRAELKEDIAKVRAELIKWMFIFGIGEIGVLTGILFALFKGALRELYG